MLVLFVDATSPLGTPALEHGETVFGEEGQRPYFRGFTNLHVPRFHLTRLTGEETPPAEWVKCPEGPPIPKEWAEASIIAARYHLPMAMIYGSYEPLRVPHGFAYYPGTFANGMNDIRPVKYFKDGQVAVSASVVGDGRDVEERNADEIRDALAASVEQIPMDERSRKEERRRQDGRGEGSSRRANEGPGELKKLSDKKGKGKERTRDTSGGKRL